MNKRFMIVTLTLFLAVLFTLPACITITGPDVIRTNELIPPQIAIDRTKKLEFPVRIERFTDSRSDRTKIGYKISGMGGTLAIVPDRDIAYVFETIVKDELERKGIRSGASVFLVKGEIQGITSGAMPFSSEVKSEIAFQLSVYNSKTRAKIWSKNYSGRAIGIDYQGVLTEAFRTLAESIRHDDSILRLREVYYASADDKPYQSKKYARFKEYKSSEEIIEDTDTVAEVSVEVNIPKARVKKSNAIAVVIGNSDYRKAKGVDFAVNDAKTIRKYLIKSLGFKSGNIFYVENATKSDFELYFGIKDNHKGKLFNSVKAGKSDIFIFYSGHGAPGLKDKKGYFIPVEADPQYIELSGYSLDVFYENIAKIPAKSLTIVLDTCFSGANVFENISPLVINVKNPVKNLSNGVVLSSSSGSQVSSWYNEKKHGMFTYFFLKAIHNKNGDSDKDGKLTYDEIYKYISDNSEGVPYYARRIHGVEQNPTIEGKYRGKVLVNY